ncbi:hypothetical protein [Microcoleus sp.]|uniref:hypothetical protein n=1 Tax=Microcoleus sp. TaxID=44472 RepID=UPI003593CBD7
MDVTIARWGDGGHGNAVSLRQNYRWGDRAMEDTAVPFPYGKIIAGAIGRWRTRQCRFPTAKLSLGRSGYNHQQHADGGNGTAPLPYKNVGHGTAPLPYKRYFYQCLKTQI